MSACCLTTVPTDVLLLISGLLDPEDSLRLIQTCKLLNSITIFKSFWLGCARRLQQRRRVHHLPLEELDISELRKAVFHTLKLDLKWSGRSGINPSPIRSVEIDPFSHTGENDKWSTVVTLVQFIENGSHLICILDYVLVQLWDISSNRMLDSFRMEGATVISSSYSDEDYIVFAASVENDSVDDPSGPLLTVFKYKWSTVTETEGRSLKVFPLPTHPDAIVITHVLVSVIYTSDILIEKGDTPGHLMFFTLTWKDPHKALRRFTPLSFFGDIHAQQARDNHLQYDRTASHLIVHFDSMASIDVYLYDLHLLNDLSPPLDFEEYDSTEAIYPRLKATYTLNHEDAIRSVSGDIMHHWSQSGVLWDGRKIGILGYLQSVETRNPFLSLSVIDLSPLLEHNDPQPNYDVRGEYRRHFVGDIHSEDLFYPTLSNRLLECLPRYATNIAWPLKLSEPSGGTIQLVVGNLSWGIFQTSVDTMASRASLGNGLDLESEVTAGKLRSLGKTEEDIRLEDRILRVDVSSWLPGSGQIEDFCLDDRLGRVACGMDDGKVLILDFV